MVNGTVACRWNEKETSYKYKVTERQDGALKVVGLSFLIGVSQQKHGHDDSNHIPITEDKPALKSLVNNRFISLHVLLT